jgi:hypothetical protein
MSGRSGNDRARRGLAGVLAAACLLPLSGCARRPITSYRVPKEAQDASPPAADVPAREAPPANTNDLPRAAAETVPFQVAASGSLLWEAPAGWKPGPGGAMRKGSYAVGTGEDAIDVSITAFPGDVGGVLANVNRWRGQAGLPPVDDAGLAAATQALDANGLHFVVVDAAGSGRRVLAALVPWQGGTWFFKMTGPDGAVGREKPGFIGFLRTVKAP